MEVYKNLSGDSGIRAFKLNPSSCVIYFEDGSAFVYDEICPETKNLAAMKILASKGRGLNTFISRFVKENYSLRLR
ncbi:MAG: hypothetical protein GY816_04325 [Cytophagales bacterium]|nr:hypothetical protein [Cytophagales bacterium]